MTLAYNECVYSFDIPWYKQALQLLYWANKQTAKIVPVCLYLHYFQKYNEDTHWSMLKVNISEQDP